NTGPGIFASYFDRKSVNKWHACTPTASNFGILTEYVEPVHFYISKQQAGPGGKARPSRPRRCRYKPSFPTATQFSLCRRLCSSRCSIHHPRTRSAIP
ncbi:unnamed protein product, partial [Laminaria digitata]